MKCGYNKNLAALDFHHRDPKEKVLLLDMRTFSNTGIESLEIEIAKCDILCANCHREEHYSDLSMENVLKLLENVEKLSFSNPTGSVCPQCGKRFPKATGKIFCSKECNLANKGYPSLEELNEQYKILKS